MGEIPKAFSIGFLLRSIFAGIFFVVSYNVACSGLEHGLEATISEGKAIPSALVVALFAGVIIYGVHRSLFPYPFIEWFFNSKFGKRRRESVPLISNSTIDTLRWRWSQGTHEASLSRKRINDRLNAWADFIHLQFTSSLCVGVGACVGWFMGGRPSFCLWIGFAGLAVLFFLAAFVSNWRSHSVLDYVREHAPNHAISYVSGKA
jgi:hypothetical protein